VEHVLVIAVTRVCESWCFPFVEKKKRTDPVEGWGMGHGRGQALSGRFFAKKA
jgi:hypothetical protein